MRLSAVQRNFLGWLASGEDGDAECLPLLHREGLAVYQNNYRTSLMACLAETYPQVLAWLGEEGFYAAAARHIDRVPPHSWTLDDYADGFPVSLSADYPEDREVGELAQIELALSQAFVAADARPLQAGQMAAVDWDSAVLQAVPALAILWLRTNATGIWTALSDDMPPPATESGQAERPLLIWRQEWLCRLRPIEADEAVMLSLLTGDGMGFADFCTNGIAQWGEAQATTRIGQWLSQWVGDGLVCVAER